MCPQEFSSWAQVEGESYCVSCVGACMGCCMDVMAGQILVAPVEIDHVKCLHTYILGI